MTHHVLTREALYEQVWSRPVRRVAQDLGVSDVGLGKACRSAGIPTPPRGFWTLIRHRKPIPPRPSLEVRPGQPEWVVIAPASARVRVSPLASANLRPAAVSLDIATLGANLGTRSPGWPVVASDRQDVFARRYCRPGG